MERDQRSHLTGDEDLLPPAPPPKMNLESPALSPELPPTPSDYFNSRSPSQSSSPSPYLDDTGPLPPPNGTSGELLSPLSPNPTADLNISSSRRGKQSKRSNPLTDLVESEREYIDLLAGIIRVRLIRISWTLLTGISLRWVLESCRSMVSYQLSAQPVGCNVQGDRVSIQGQQGVVDGVCQPSSAYYIPA